MGRGWAVAVLVLACGCIEHGPGQTTGDAGPQPSGSLDASQPDARVLDGGMADAALPDANRPDAAYLGDGGLIACATDEECDDGDPATHDWCYTLQHVCVNWECTTQADCDDDDPVTEDRCNVFQNVCEHDFQPNRCHSPGDCYRPLACVSATCDGNNLCAFDWSDGCGVSGAPLPSCAAVGAIENAICCDGPTCVANCVLGEVTPGCPTRLVCNTRYERVQPASPACNTACPAAPPAYGTACTATDLRCDYEPHTLQPDWLLPHTHLGLGPECRCTAGTWVCSGDVCPERPPADGSPANLPAWHQGGQRCEYLGRLCNTRFDANGNLVWRCVTPIACPPPPTTGSPCLVGADDRCSYARFMPDQPVTAYAGQCVCTAEGTWECSPSRSTACPTATVVDEDMCIYDPGNQHCVYFDRAGAQNTCACRSGLGSDAWNCY